MVFARQAFRPYYQSTYIYIQLSVLSRSSFITPYAAICSFRFLGSFCARVVFDGAQGNAVCIQGRSKLEFLLTWYTGVTEIFFYLSLNIASMHSKLSIICYLDFLSIGVSYEWAWKEVHHLHNLIVYSYYSYTVNCMYQQKASPWVTQSLTLTCCSIKSGWLLVCNCSCMVAAGAFLVYLLSAS